MLKKIGKAALFAVGVVVVTEAWRVAKEKATERAINLTRSEETRMEAIKALMAEAKERAANLRRGAVPVPHEDVTS
jgi:hypothetical protein